jgi:hypothetical protein
MPTSDAVKTEMDLLIEEIPKLINLCYGKDDDPLKFN